MPAIFPGWKVVVGAGAGIAFGSAVFISSSFSLLAAAMGAQFGWTQPQVALGASIVLFMQIFTFPLAGWIADALGSRRAAMIAIALFSISLFALSQIGSALWSHVEDPLMQYYAAFLFMGLVAAGTNVVSYTRALTLWFDKRRGLAIGLAAAFQAIGASVMPIAFQMSISTWGWPVSLLLLSGFLLVVCLPIVSAMVKDSPEPFGLHPDGAVAPRARDAAAENQERPNFRSLIADKNFRKLAISFSVMGFASYAFATNSVFILTKTANLTVEQVSVIQAITGASVLLGRIGFGVLLDKFNSAGVAFTAILLGAGVFASFGFTTNYEVLVLTAVVCGISLGGESDLMPYLAGRYFGREAVSTVFGWFLSAFVIGAALGPILFAQASAYIGSPVPVLFAIAALHIIPAYHFLTMTRPNPMIS